MLSENYIILNLNHMKEKHLISNCVKIFPVEIRAVDQGALLSVQEDAPVHLFMIKTDHHLHHRAVAAVALQITVDQALEVDQEAILLEEEEVTRPVRVHVPGLGPLDRTGLRGQTNRIGQIDQIDLQARPGHQDPHDRTDQIDHIGLKDRQFRRDQIDQTGQLDLIGQIDRTVLVQDPATVLDRVRAPLIQNKAAPATMKSQQQQFKRNLMNEQSSASQLSPKQTHIHEHKITHTHTHTQNSSQLLLYVYKYAYIYIYIYLYTHLYICLS